MNHESRAKDYEPIIGFEIHVELKTASKMFCGCKNDPFHAGKPNIYTCPVCLGLPGALPVPNKKAIEWTVRLGQALGCEIPFFAKFDRKHYFYPDLPKGYQISQYDEPFAVSGKLEIRNSKFEIRKEIRIRRVHLEEDTGKLIHATVDGKQVSLIDFNRSGVPLVEIVTEPDIRSADEAKIFLQKLQQIIRYLGISDCDMEKGSMRLEPNISIKVKSQKSKVKSNQEEFIEESDLPNYKVEVKNINSFRFVGRAIEYEIERQSEILRNGKTPAQETRGFSEGKNATVSQRSKEEAHDYRYFPEPDIPPIHWQQSTINNQQSTINNQQSTLPELPDEKLKRFVSQYKLSEQDANRLIETRELADYYEEAVRVATKTDIIITPKAIANWIINKKINIEEVVPAQLVAQIKTQTAIVFIPDDALSQAIQKVIDSNPKAVTDYKSGKETVVMFLVGQVMREIKGKGNAQQIKEMFIKKLNQK